MEDNVTNRLLAEILMARRRGEARSYGWPQPTTRQPESPPYIIQQPEPDPHWTSRLAEPRDFESPRPRGLRAAEDWSRSPRTPPAWPAPNFDNITAPERAQQAPPEPCFDNPEHTSISTKKGHQFCTRFGAFTIFPTILRPGFRDIHPKVHSWAELRMGPSRTIRVVP